MSDTPETKPSNAIVHLLDTAAPYAPEDASAREGSEVDAPLPEDDGPGYLDDEPEDDGTPPDPVLMLCAAERQNDTGNARRFRHRYGDLAEAGQQVVHVLNIGWFCWDEKRWKEDEDGKGLRPLAQRVAELIGLETKLITPTEDEAMLLEIGVDAADAVERIEADIATLEKDEKPDQARLKKLKNELKYAQRQVSAAEAVEKRIQRRKSDRLRHGNSSGNKGKLDGMLAEALPYMSRKIRDFDTAELDLNVENGTLYPEAFEVEDLECPDPDTKRFRTEWRIKLRPHERQDFNSKLAPVTYDPEAQSPVFDAFIAQIMPNENLRDYLRRFFGYALTRRTSEQTFAIFHGEGANGKSTLVDVIARILDDYATTIPVSSLMADNARKGQDATPDLAKLPGARFLRTSEPKEGLALDEALIKELTGGEPINVRRLNQDFVEVYPEFKLVISCNRKPRILGNDDGIWRRIALVPFSVQIPKEERDKNLSAKLWAERSGILNWMLAGLVDYLSRGKLDPPQEVLAATQEWRDDSDVMGAWARAALAVTHDNYDRIETGPLYESFVIYSKRIGMTPIAGTTFNRRLVKTAGDFGFVKGKASVSYYEGIKFKDGFDPALQPSHTRFNNERS